MAAPRAVALYSPPAPPRPVAMFNHCNNVTINGGTFILSAPEINDSDSDEDFRRIRLGDINLLKLIHEVAIVDDAVTRHREDSPGRAIIGVRKTYHAKIFPSSELFTVMSYEGLTSEVSFAHYI
ncbi:MFS general substrate transporter [Mycena chlorophos]|uniref:MFS general substrate transporter n=1 Tax=Mycena chlorophos TaxID=658473 RepID=A0A8H6WJA8_MYCCL|nr:MFS general substrate transporter [Mycena chlorophos]